MSPLDSWMYLSLVSLITNSPSVVAVALSYIREKDPKVAKRSILFRFFNFFSREEKSVASS